MKSTERNDMETYERLCLKSLASGSRIFPEGKVPKGGSHPAIVELVDLDNGRAIVKSSNRGSRLVTEATLAARWTWIGKPPVPTPPAPVLNFEPEPAKKNHTRDNLSPMWQAIRRLEADMEALKRDLGIKVEPVPLTQ